VGGTCEYGNELSGSINAGNYFDAKNGALYFGFSDDDASMMTHVGILYSVCFFSSFM
jgi:hypothetical protein